jgi:hypothetical protein
LLLTFPTNWARLARACIWRSLCCGGSSEKKNSAELARLERETGKLSSLGQQLLLLAGLEAGAAPRGNPGASLDAVFV